MPLFVCGSGPGHLAPEFHNVSWWKCPPCVPLDFGGSSRLFDSQYDFYIGHSASVENHSPARVESSRVASHVMYLCESIYRDFELCE